MLCRFRRPHLAKRRPVRCGGRLVFVAAVAAAVLLADPPVVWAVATIPEVISNLRAWIVGLLAGLATLFLTFGSVRYLTAGGDPGEIEAAKRALKSAAIGYGLAILAPVFVVVLQHIVGLDDGGGQ
ncbi:pilin [Streptomyces luomodiensis]|uniref:Pilin n=1 Tax=Streptomyces luomodiensis TaxID=3026192 RepID=A0ABY9UTB6_9ACTN|nr:pilin [Streptomyces sp. SCA4-21]WNE95516.1 pilin [Streptomyces sp. SCA4-21]